jgi:hypothetical protein
VVTIHLAGAHSTETRGQEDFAPGDRMPIGCHIPHGDMAAAEIIQPDGAVLRTLKGRSAFMLLPLSQTAAALRDGQSQCAR